MAKKFSLEGLVGGGINAIEAEMIFKDLKVSFNSLSSLIGEKGFVRICFAVTQQHHDPVILDAAVYKLGGN